MATRIISSTSITSRQRFCILFSHSYTSLPIKSSSLSSHVSRRLRPVAALLNFTCLSPATSFLRCYNSKTSSLENIRPDWKQTTTLLDADEQWLIVMNTGSIITRSTGYTPTKEEIIEFYVENLSPFVGSEEAARLKFYRLSTKSGLHGLAPLISKQVAHKMRHLEIVHWMTPISYQDILWSAEWWQQDVEDIVHGEDLFVNGDDWSWLPIKKHLNYSYFTVWLRCEREAKKLIGRPCDSDKYSRNFGTRINYLQAVHDWYQYEAGIWPTGSNCDYDSWEVEDYSYERDMESFKKGDYIDLSSLLFTKNRDYLIRYNDPLPVTAKHLAGKVVVIYFVPLHLDPGCCMREFTKSLKDTYNDLKFKNCFEVVLVVVDDDFPSFDGELGKLRPDPTFRSKFEYILSQCPSFPAIPFSDLTTRKCLKRRFGLFRSLFHPEEVLIDSTGMVMETFPQKLFHTYGSEAYPFSNEMIRFLEAKDETTFSQTSLKALLGSLERDFVISNKGEKVPIHTLEDKVVALFFYEEGVMSDHFTIKLKKCYEELAKKNRNFEVVLLYLYDTRERTLSTNEETFWNTYKTMPWLALPYKDPAHKKLKRIFGYPDFNWNGSCCKPTLVICGPRSGIIEPDAATVLRGYDANQFRPEEFAKVEAESRELKLEMLCSPDTVFKKQDGSQVLFSQLAGKSILFLFEGDYPEYDGFHFREKLKERYLHVKGTADEFEVIYFPNSKDEIGKLVADVPWLVSHIEEMSHGSAFLSFYCESNNRYQSSFVLAFGRNGSLVRKMICPEFGDMSFPFCADGAADDFDIMSSKFCWGYWDTLYQGLLRDSKSQVNFPSGDLLFCIYYY